MKFRANATFGHGLQILTLFFACIFIFSACDASKTNNLITQTIINQPSMTTIVGATPVVTVVITTVPSSTILTNTSKATTPAILKIPQSIDDIPLPPQAKKVNDTLSKTDAHDVAFSFSVPASIYPNRGEIYSFFQRELPPLGWKPCRNASCEESLATWSDAWYESYRYGTERSGPFLQIQTYMTYDYDKKIQGEGGGFFTLHFYKN